MSKSKKAFLVEISAGVVDVDNRLWFSAIGFNSLFCYNIIEDNLEWKGIFPEETYWKSFLYRNCVIYRNNIVFAPYNAKNFVIYNTITNSFKTVKIPEIFQEKSMKFYCMTVFKDNVIAFGDKVPCILTLNMQTFEVTQNDKLYEELNLNGKKEVDYFICRKIISQSDTERLLIGAKTNILIHYDVSNMKYWYERLGDDSGIYNNFIKDGDYLFLVPGKNRKFAVWDMGKKKLYEYGTTITQNAQYYLEYEFDNSIVILPEKGDAIIRWKKDSNELNIDYELMKSLSDGCTELSDNGEIAKFLFVNDNDNYRVLFSRINKKLYIFDKHEKTVRSKELLLDLRTRNVIKTEMEKGMGNIWIENAFYSLADFLGEDI